MTALPEVALLRGRQKEASMKWLLLLTILSGYSGSSTVTVKFESKEACEAAAKSHEQAIHELRWHSFAVMQRDDELVQNALRRA
jgi:hypothetical protein